MNATPDPQQDPSSLPAHAPLSFREFVILIAALMALNALAIDIMLPALQEIGSALGVQNENRRQAVLSVYLIGFGAGQLLIGTISDRFGRRSVLLCGLVVSVLAAALCSLAPSFEALLVGRVLQGLASAAPRVITISVVRDCYKGRRMASVMSLSMMVFMAVPVLAPTLGQLIILVAPWRGIFGLLTLYGLAMLLWVFLRMPEPLPAASRRSVAPRAGAIDGGKALYTSPDPAEELRRVRRKPISWLPAVLGRPYRTWAPCVAPHIACSSNQEPHSLTSALSF